MTRWFLAAVLALPFTVQAAEPRVSPSLGTVWHADGNLAYTPHDGRGFHDGGRLAWDPTTGRGFHADGSLAWHRGSCFEADGRRAFTDTCTWSWGDGVAFTVTEHPGVRACALRAGVGIVLVPCG